MLPKSKSEANNDNAGQDDDLARDILDYKVDLEKDTKKTIAELQEDTRSKTTIQIVVLYTLCIAFLVVASIITALLGTPEQIGNLKAADDFIKGLLLPVVTFVLGFYYAGKS